MTRKKCKENYKVENDELYFRKSGRGSKKGPETECNDVWKKVHFITYEHSLYNNCYLQLSFAFNIIL